MPTCTLLPSQLVVPLRRYVQAFRQGKQMCALDGPAAAPERYGTLPPHAALLPDPTGMPEWDDASCAHQTRLTHSPPSHVPAPTSKAAHPSLPPQRRVLLTSCERP